MTGGNHSKVTML